MSGHALAAIGGIAVLALGGAGLVMKLFWPAGSGEPQQGDPWAQHNDTRMPSLEKLPRASDTSVDAAIAAQIVGD